MITEKRGQAAMEFLMTYGWAILAAVIVIAVLASFGVFSPSKYIPQTCIVSAPFGCVKNQVAASEGGGLDGQLTLVLTNGGGEMVQVSSVAVNNCGSVVPAVDWADGEERTLIIDCEVATPLGAKGTKFSGDITIDYLIEGGTLPMKSSGTVTVEVGA